VTRDLRAARLILERLLRIVFDFGPGQAISIKRSTQFA
jgi:hypothetical protein